MTIEQIKAEAKKRFGQDITDEQAEAILENHSSEELSAQVLEEVTGGANNIKIKYVDRNMSKKMPNVYLLLEQMNEEATRRLKSYGSGELSAQELEEVAGGATDIKIKYVDHIRPDDSEQQRFFVSDIPNFETLERLGFPSELTEAMLKAYDSGELSAQELEDVAGGGYYHLDVCHNGTEPGTINIYDTEELSPQELGEVRGGSDLKLRILLPKDLLSKLEPYAADGRLKEWLAAYSSKELSDEDLDNVAGGCGLFGPKHTRKVCPDCGGKNLKQTREGNFWNNMCEDCGWHEGGVDY